MSYNKTNTFVTFPNRRSKALFDILATAGKEMLLSQIENALQDGDYDSPAVKTQWSNQVVRQLDDLVDRGLVLHEARGAYELTDKGMDLYHDLKQGVRSAVIAKNIIVI